MSEVLTHRKPLKHELAKHIRDVLISSPADGQVLTYEAATSLWKNKSAPPPGPHKDTHKTLGSDAFVLADLLDCVSRLKFISPGGVLVGTRRALKFISGKGVAILLSDDAANEKVDATFYVTPFRDFIFHADGASTVWTNMPAALTEFLGSTRHRTLIYATDLASMRLIVNVQTAGSANAKIRMQYSLDQATWYYLDQQDGGGTNPSVSISSTGIKNSGWATLDEAARVSALYVRLVGIDGDGAADPAFGNILVTCSG